MEQQQDALLHSGPRVPLGVAGAHTCWCMRQKAEKWRQRTKSEYARIFEAVRTVIHEFDPYGLLALGSPTDEFDSEIKAIVKQIDRIGSAHDAAHVIARVLGASFDHERFTFETCQDPGQQLYEILKEDSLIK